MPAAASTANTGMVSFFMSFLWGLSGSLGSLRVSPGLVGRTCGSLDHEGLEDPYRNYQECGVIDSEELDPVPRPVEVRRVGDQPGGALGPGPEQRDQQRVED